LPGHIERVIQLSFKDWSEERYGLGPGDQGTHFLYFVYRVADDLLGQKFGSPGAAFFQFEPNFKDPRKLTIFNENGEIVLSDSIKQLEIKLRQL